MDGWEEGFRWVGGDQYIGVIFLALGSGMGGTGIPMFFASCIVERASVGVAIENVSHCIAAEAFGL
jgi:hypothetical protein